MRNRLLSGTELLNKPALVLLNKSDSIFTTYKKPEVLYGRGDEAFSHLKKHGGVILNLFFDVFEKDKLTFAFHSPVGKVRKASKSELSNYASGFAPCYEYLDEICADTYTETFRALLREI